VNHFYSEYLFKLGLWCLSAEILNEIAVDLSEKCQAFQHESLDGSSGDHFVGLQTGVRVNSPHQQLLMVLSNLGYCKAALLPGLLKKYQHMWTSSG
jgi:exocyst complex component 2